MTLFPNLAFLLRVRDNGFMSRPKVVHRRTRAVEIAATLKRERPDLDPVDYLYLIYIQRAGHIVDTLFERYCRKDFGIGAADMRVLLALRRAGPDYALRPTELFRSLLVTSGAITKQVDRLLALGYVDRIEGPPRSGGLLVRLTPKGRRLADRAMTALVDSAFPPADSLSRKEREALCKILEKMLTRLEPQMEEPTNETSARPPVKSAAAALD
jgi:DNA-binding MarR family transcriptional regulator